MRISAALAVLTCLLALGCQEPLGDGEHDDFTFAGGSADVFGVEEGSCQARGALQVANETSEETLRAGVGLRSIAARNLVEARADGPLETLVELDAVPWIGPVSFDLIVSYAVEQGFVADCARGSREASGYHVSLRVVAGGESFDETDGDWTYDEDEWEYVHTLEQDVDALPFRHSVGNLSVSVSAEGEVDLSYITGDYDGSATSTASLPLEVPAGTTFTVGLSGGEHASGAWNVDATLTIEVR